MKLIEVLGQSFDGNHVGTVVILAMLATCIVGCVIVVYDTTRETIDDIRYLIKQRKNKKTKK